MNIVAARWVHLICKDGRHNKFWDAWTFEEERDGGDRVVLSNLWVAHYGPIKRTGTVHIYDLSNTDVTDKTYEKHRKGYGQVDTRFWEFPESPVDVNGFDNDLQWIAWFDELKHGPNITAIVDDLLGIACSLEPAP